MEFDGNSHVDLSTSDGNSSLHDKIGVVQQVLTLLENTLSSAKSTHQQNQTSYQIKIDELELRIQNLRQEMQRDAEDFDEISKSLGNNIQKYLNLENQLLTIEERSHDDYVQLPELNTSTDIYVAQYLPHEYTDWQRLKLQCQFLNQTTQNYFRKNICVTRYQVSVESDSESTQRYMQTVEKANALNLLRGKKFVSPSSSPQSRFVTLTWYRNEVAAKYHVQKNYQNIIEQVFKEQYEEYKGRSISITELRSAYELGAALTTELTIHVQAKTSSALNTQNIMPRRITLYQFDETPTYIPPTVTTFNIETAPAPAPTNPTVQLDSDIVASSSNTVFTCDNGINNPGEIKQSKKTKRPQPKSRRSPDKLFSPPVDDVLSLIGLDDDTMKNSENMNVIIVPSEECSNAQRRNSPVSKASDTEPLVPLLDLRRFTEFDGINMSECTLDYIQEKGIQKLTDAQKQLINSFNSSGDILYVSNGGAITAVAIGLLNCIDLSKEDCVQALIITPNSRSSNLIQKEIELTGTIHSALYRTLVDQLFQTEEPYGNNESKENPLKTAKRPSCRIIIGTLFQMKTFVLKNLLHKSSIRFLILHNAEEIYGTATDNQKENALSINKIIYALDATVKVVVVRQSTSICTELDAFCERKLRRKQFIKETVNVSGLSKTRARLPSDGKKSSSTGSDSETRLRISVCTDSSELCRAHPSTSKSGVTDSDSSSVLSVHANSEGDRHTEKCEEPEWRTLLSENAIQLLGISKNVGNETTVNEPEDLDDDIAHLFANIENGDESCKIDMLSMLNLEEDKAIIFCDSIDKAEWISARLRQKQLWPQVLHENVLPKDQRVILQSYRQGNLCRVLICTDFVSSISLDSADVVLNFDLPKSKSTYISRAAFALRHIRKARTSKGNAKGVVVNLILNDYHKLKEFEKSLGITIHNCDD